jgi:hypothetical protein
MSFDSRTLGGSLGKGLISFSSGQTYGKNTAYCLRVSSQRFLLVIQGNTTQWESIRYTIVDSGVLYDKFPLLIFTGNLDELRQ